jgi:hypothetical protein
MDNACTLVIIYFTPLVEQVHFSCKYLQKITLLEACFKF